MTTEFRPPAGHGPVTGFLKAHWIRAAALAYCCVLYLGMIGAWFRYRAFDTNVFEFTEINDFFVMAYRQPLAFGINLLTVVIAISLDQASETFRVRIPALRCPFWRRRSAPEHPTLGPGAAHPAGAIALAAALLTGCSSGSNEAPPVPPPVPPPTGTVDPPPAPPPTPTLGTGPEDCTDGRAGDFPCSGVSLAARVTLETIGGAGATGSDLWGWTDPQTAREYALMGLSDGTAFVDVTEPQSPLFLGRLPTHTADALWRDIKVYRNHAYIVADRAGAHGMQVFDLTRLRGVSGPQVWAADVIYGDFGHSHNLAIDEDSGYAYAVSTDTCEGGLHIVNLATPNNPLFAGCHNVTRTHDTQCVVYEGPDAAHRGRQICVSSNEDRLEVVDVTEKAAPLSLSSVTYPQMSYVHQGWLTEDHRYFLLGDEMDEIELNLSTRTHVFDVSDLDAPVHLYAHELGTSATDHNLYVLGDRVFEANYTSGLRVLRFGDLASRDIAEIAFFDTYPDSDGPGTDDGAWSVYPYLPSGTILVADIANGLFVLSMP